MDVALISDTHVPSRESQIPGSNWAGSRSPSPTAPSPATPTSYWTRPTVVFAC